ncbi:hypothetical protein REC12_11875 [Desulfosporosinus sp. PR]|uniref:hypothetical protein n=1 Tax=Candidatus Desulfosporosinus nitrosoreducens TaxID=3401928 RepID=UPI0027EB2270|nr:hypothetical protein [Desulfosporosinus sp. PR]MDQ7094288.1 hypothetical protein [Desulfosporosinus sp. PR]
MFEQTLEKMTGSIIIDQSYKTILDHNGFSFDFKIGYNNFSYPIAVALIDRMYEAVSSVPKYQKKRFVSVIYQIIFAFGPEFEALHYKKII